MSISEKIFTKNNFDSSKMWIDSQLNHLNFSQETKRTIDIRLNRLKDVLFPNLEVKEITEKCLEDGLFTLKKRFEEVFTGHVFTDSEGKEKSITLDIDKTIVSYLAETELLISIKEAGFDSFDTCWKHIVKQHQAGASTYHIKYIRVDKNKQVSFKDISFSPELILSFVDLEKRTDKLTIYTAFSQ